jgi:hypothetical protein
LIEYNSSQGKKSYETLTHIQTAGVKAMALKKNSEELITEEHQLPVTIKKLTQQMRSEAVFLRPRERRFSSSAIT